MTKSSRIVTVSFALLSLLATATAFAQNSDLQQKLAAVKQAVADNKQKLQQYQWTGKVIGLMGDVL